MHIRCPHCQQPVEIVDDSSFRDVTCPSCGSHFSLVGSDAPTQSGPAKPRRLAHFELIEQLGVGQFGAVWKAKDTTLDRFVAVKIPRNEQLDPADIDKFFREARAAAQLRHPNIVTVHEVGREGNTIFIASDYVEGATLGEWLKRQPQPPRDAARLCVKIADALHAAHEAGVVHRDLKPNNIMMDLDGEPHILDFGLAKRESGEITVTVEGALLGTPAYMPPEQASGKGHDADRRSDVYSLGVILFEMLTGELPFRGEKRMLIVQIQRDEPPSLRKLKGDIPRDLETICLQCLEKSPDKRYQSASELTDDLTRFLDGKPIKARPVGRINRIAKWVRRHPAATGVMAAASIALITIMIGDRIYSSMLKRALSNAELQKKTAQYHQNRRRVVPVDADAFVSLLEDSPAADREGAKATSGCWAAFVLTADPPPVELSIEWDRQELQTTSLPTPARSPAMIVLHAPPHVDDRDRSFRAYWVHDGEVLTTFSFPLREVIRENAGQYGVQQAVLIPPSEEKSDGNLDVVESGLKILIGQHPGDGHTLSFRVRFHLHTTRNPVTDTLRTIARGRRFEKEYRVQFVSPNQTLVPSDLRAALRYDPEKNLCAVDSPGLQWGSSPTSTYTQVLDVDEESITFEVCTMSGDNLVNVDHLRVTNGDSQSFSPQPSDRFPEPLIDPWGMVFSVPDDQR